MKLPPSLLGALAIIAISVARAGAANQVYRSEPSTFHRGLLIPPPGPVLRSPAEHAIFGYIMRLDKRTFTLRLRSGRKLEVNAAAAIASGHFSQPLFVGKPVLVTGTFDAHGTLIARTVIRQTRIDATTRNDR